jgi:hypothetical protein
MFGWKRPRGILRRRCEDNIKMVIMVIGLEGVNWINGLIWLRIGPSDRLL